MPPDRHRSGPHEHLVQSSRPAIGPSGRNKEESRSALSFDFRFRTCTASTLAGHYGFTAQGSAGAPTLPGVTFGPLAAVGTLSLNPDGTFRMISQRSLSGAVDAQVSTLNGKFAVGSDCAYKLTFDAGYHYDAISTSRDEAILIETDAGTAVTLRITKQ